MLNDCISVHNMMKQIEDGTYHIGEGFITVGGYDPQVDKRLYGFKTDDEFPHTLNDFINPEYYNYDKMGVMVVIYEGYKESMVFRYDGKKWNLCGSFDGIGKIL